MKRIKIQPKELKDLTLPYPYFIEKKGYIGRQDFWQGNPYILLGFSKLPKAGEIDLYFKDFWKTPKKAIGMYPVFSDVGDNWNTQTNKIESVKVLNS